VPRLPGARTKQEEPRRSKRAVPPEQDLEVNVVVQNSKSVVVSQLKFKALSGVSLALALLPLALGCGAKPPPAAETVTVLDAGPPVEDAAADSEPEESDASDAALPLPPAETPEEVAERWLEALRRGDPALLATWSRYPFLLHDTGAEGLCGHGAASDDRQLSMLLGCILHNESLLTELRNHTEPVAHTILPKDLPTWARRFRFEAPNDATLVVADIAGRGTSSHFVLVVREGGVQSLWKQTVFDTN
jgi:hypothetical protein